MVKIIMHGCNGKMGQVISDLVIGDEHAVIVAGIDIKDNIIHEYPVYTEIEDCKVKADVMIDFSTAKAVEKVLKYAVQRKLPLVLCTTGLSEEQLEQVGNAAKHIPILRSANMSLGINTVMRLLNVAAGLLADAGFDIEIVEKHHNQKIDAPSGTALALADVINETLNNEYQYTFDRSKERTKRVKKEIGIHAVRGGTIVGEHEVIFAGTDEVIEIRHTAYSKAIFGKGAIEAARFLAGTRPGLYDMKDVVNNDGNF